MINTNIIIEIGTPEIKELIKTEINNFIEIIRKTFEGWFDVLIIPEYFEKTIRELTSNQNYSAIRGKINVMAKFITINKEKTLVLNPYIFNDDFDTQIRFKLLLHETNHFINAHAKPSLEGLSIADKKYMEHISIFYEEYCAERFSNVICEKIFSTKSPRYMKSIKGYFQGHCEIISDMSRTYKEIRKVLDDFRCHHNGDRFLQEIRPLIEPPILSYSYLLAFQKEIIGFEDIEMIEFPKPFNQPASIDIAELCHKAYPEPLEIEKTLDKTRRFISQFGFEFKNFHNDLLWIGIIDV